MDLLLSSPLWIVLIVVTVALHVGFAIAVRRMIRRDEARRREAESGRRDDR